MIRIRKSSQAPDILTGRGQEETAEIKQLYDQNPEAYHQKYHRTNNPFKFSFKSSIYGAAVVKKQLKNEQHNKCCFCENKDFDDLAYGDVEHFRPKGRYQQKEGDPYAFPGYYWLAYDWNNLFFSCQICNTSYKRNYFPIADPARRQKSHHHPEETIDEVLLIDPSKENPEQHIGFREEVPYGKTPKGEASIEGFGLDRIELNEKRKRHLMAVEKNMVLSIYDYEDILPSQLAAIKALLGTDDDQQIREILAAAKSFVASCKSDKAAFSAVVSAKFPDL
ncbi:MAG: hypothetical protein AAFO69_18610 [Bacteroidota bacterium]